MGLSSDSNPMVMVEQEVARTIEDLDLHSYYQLLEVARDASSEQIAVHHELLTREYRQILGHPRCSAGLRANLTLLIERLDEALLVLGDWLLRTGYDQRLELGETRVAVRRSPTGTFSLDDFEREVGDTPQPTRTSPSPPRRPPSLLEQPPLPDPPPAPAPLPRQPTGLDALASAPEPRDLQVSISASPQPPPGSPPQPAERPGPVPPVPAVSVPPPEESFTDEVEPTAERSSQILRRFMSAVESLEGDTPEFRLDEDTERTGGMGPSVDEDTERTVSPAVGLVARGEHERGT